MATGTGLNVSKANGYAVLWSNPGLNCSKVNAYAVLGSADVTPPSWPSFTFAGGVQNLAYSQSFTPLGAASVTVSLQSGSLPTGLSLSNVSGSTWKIAGTPTVLGASSFTLRASNSYGTADASFTITIVAAGSGYSFCFTS